MNMLQTVEFDIALALQLRSQNVSLIAVTISGIIAVTWKIIKVPSGEHHLLYSNSARFVLSQGQASQLEPSNVKLQQPQALVPWVCQPINLVNCLTLHPVG